MNKLSFKKFLPGLVSVIIIAGMAASTFATNIDLAAFVNMDKYLTKYYELDWRIKDIEKSLDRLYKFTCKNVVSFKGTYTSENAPGTPFYQNSNGTAYLQHTGYVAFLDDPKALRLGTRNNLTYYGAQGAASGSYKFHTNTFVREIPASVCKWNQGIELLPNTKITVTHTDYVNSAANDTYTTTIIMGPFKKVPKFTGGSSQTTGYICELPFCLTTTTHNWTNAMSYNYNTETQPTSWTSIGSDVQSYTYGYYKSGWSSSQYPALTAADFENGDVALGKKSLAHTMFYFAGGNIADLSSRTNVWLRLYYSGSGQSGPATWLSMDEVNLTSWNNNK